MTPEAYARSLIFMHEAPEFIPLCMADFEEALERAESEGERNKVVRATIATYVGHDDAPVSVPVIAPAEVVVVAPLTEWRLKNQFKPRPQSRPRAKRHTPRGASW